MCYSYLVGLGIIQTLIGALKLPQNEIICVSLDGITGILESGGKVVFDERNPYALMLVESPELGELVNCGEYAVIN